MKVTEGGVGTMAQARMARHTHTEGIGKKHNNGVGVYNTHRIQLHTGIEKNV